MKTKTSKKEELWLIGVVCEEKTKDGKDTWMCEGIFSSEQDAINNCKKEEFIILCAVNKRLPAEVVDALCVYWPHLQTKKEAAKKVKQLKNKKK